MYTQEKPPVGGEIVRSFPPDGMEFGLIREQLLAPSAVASVDLKQKLPAGSVLLSGALAFASAITLATGVRVGLGTSTDPTLAAISGTTMTVGTVTPTQKGPGDLLHYGNKAASTAITNTATETAFDKAVTIPANLLKPGDIIEIDFQGIATATNGADTLAIKAYIGATVVAIQAAVDVANNDTFQGKVVAIVRKIGATGTIVASLMAPPVGAGKADGTSAITYRAGFIASSAIDTTAANSVAIKATWSAADPGNSARLDVIAVRVMRPGLQPVLSDTTLQIASVDDAGVAAGTLLGTVNAYVWFIRYGGVGGSGGIGGPNDVPTPTLATAGLAAS